MDFFKSGEKQEVREKLTTTKISAKIMNNIIKDTLMLESWHHIT